MIRIAGVVVLYNPSENVFENINSYLGQIDKLFVIDNSEIPCESLKEQFIGFTKIKYSHFGKNIGIAKALNIAAKKAIEDGYSFLLTMDQDTSLSDNIFYEYRKYLSGTINNNVGIITLHHKIENYYKKQSNKEYENIQSAFTSGSLINLEVFNKVGPFKESFFIDYVDHEYCLRLRKMNYKIVRINSVYCKHKLGNMEARRILGVNIPISHHSPLRLYYRTRNRLYVVSHYYKSFTLWIVTDMIRFFYEVIILTLFESNKKEKIKMILKGVTDFTLGRFGKFIEKEYIYNK
jgi:rhamnosyltransferase